MTKKTIAILLFCATSITVHAKENKNMALTAQQVKELTFSCIHETFPEKSSSLEEIFKYARWLEKNNQLKKSKDSQSRIERLYRIAGENGHIKSLANLQYNSLRGKSTLSDSEMLRFSQKMIDEKSATGYYFIYMYLNHGLASLKQDPDMALKFLRKAADQGNANAQAAIAELLSPKAIAPDIARKMRRCAAEQGNSEAARYLGSDFQDTHEYQSALEAFQLGVAAGDEISASFLKSGFRGPLPSNLLNYLYQPMDLERAKRYEAIGLMLGRWSYANPKVPEINEIVPLPPAVLPPWDGKLQWVEERLANIPPPEPSEYELRELAKASFLEPDTGKPTPEHPGFERKNIPSLLTESANPCPRTGYWSTTLHHEYHRHDPFEDEHVTRRFTEGTLLPTMVETQLHRRLWPWPDEVIKQVVNVRWEYIG